MRHRWPLAQGVLLSLCGLAAPVGCASGGANDQSSTTGDGAALDDAEADASCASFAPTVLSSQASSCASCTIANCCFALAQCATTAQCPAIFRSCFLDCNAPGASPACSTACTAGLDASVSEGYTAAQTLWTCQSSGCNCGSTSGDAGGDGPTGPDAGGDSTGIPDAITGDADVDSSSPPDATSGDSGVPTTGLVGEWLCSGNTSDTSGSGDDGTPTNVTFVADRHGNPGAACSFDGATSHVAIGPASSLDVTSTWSLSAWIQPSSFAFLAGIASKYQSPAANGFTVRLAYGSPYTAIDVNETTSTGAMPPAGILTANTWAHVAVTVNGLSVQCFVNGAPYYSRSAGYATQVDTDPLELGVDFLNGGPRFFAGAIDDVRLYDRVLTGAEVQALYTAP